MTVPKPKAIHAQILSEAFCENARKLGAHVSADLTEVTCSRCLGNLVRDRPAYYIRLVAEGAKLETPTMKRAVFKFCEQLGRLRLAVPVDLNKYELSPEDGSPAAILDQTRRHYETSRLVFEAARAQYDKVSAFARELPEMLAALPAPPVHEPAEESK